MNDRKVIILREASCVHVESRDISVIMLNVRLQTRVQKPAKADTGTCTWTSKPRKLLTRCLSCFPSLYSNQESRERTLLHAVLNWAGQRPFHWTSGVSAQGTCNQFESHLSHRLFAPFFFETIDIIDPRILVVPQWMSAIFWHRRGGISWVKGWSRW